MSMCLNVCISECMCVFVDFKNINVLFKFLFLNMCVLQCVPFVGTEPHTVGPRQASQCGFDLSQASYGFNWLGNNYILQRK